MSAEAAAKLRKLWEQLEFFTVARTVAREPEDVQRIEIQKPGVGVWPNGEPMLGSIELISEYTQLSQVPEADRWRARVVWRYFYGFTTEGIHFDHDSYNELNWYFSHSDGLLTFDEGSTYCAGPPDPGQLICGLVENTPGGKRLAKWFVCDEAFRLLVTAVREGTEHTEEELGRLLLTDDFPDVYWALARLVLFDNVQAFVDCIKIGSPGLVDGPLSTGDRTPRDTTAPSPGAHPALGRTYGHYQLSVDWKGMYIGIEFAQFVHMLSYILGEPRWWEEFLQLTASQGVRHWHPCHGGICPACKAANPGQFSGDENWPYQMG
jgi:hypothetical protein